MPRVILKLFLNLSDFEPRHSYDLYSYKKKARFLFQQKQNSQNLYRIDRLEE